MNDCSMIYDTEMNAFFFKLSDKASSIDNPQWKAVIKSLKKKKDSHIKIEDEGIYMEYSLLVKMLVETIESKSAPLELCLTILSWASVHYEVARVQCLERIVVMPRVNA